MTDPKARRAVFVVGLAAAFPFFISCGLSPVLPTPGDCSSVSGLFFADDVFADAGHPCFAWLDAVHGRVARSSSNGSAAIWSLRTERGTGVLVSAVHTLGVGYLGPGGEDLDERLLDPADEMGVARIRLIESGGRVVGDDVSPMFTIYHPAIPADENQNNFRDILPVHDFFVAAIDGQRLDAGPPPESPGPIEDSAPAIYDPDGLTTTSPTFTSAAADDTVLIVGFPTEGRFGGALVASVGRVMSDVAGEEAVEALAAAGDEEGGITYAAEVEMFIEGSAAGGMSGGGIFDVEGVLVGVLVRATEAVSLPQYVRAVRMTHVAAELGDALSSESGGRREAIGRSLDASD